MIEAIYMAGRGVASVVPAGATVEPVVVEPVVVVGTMLKL